MRNERSAGAVLFTGPRDSTSFLLLRHKEDGHWGFPKGHIEEGEDEIDCAIREIAEETGITRKQIEFLLGFGKTIDYTHKAKDGEEIHKEATYLLALVEGPVSVALSPEHMDYVWAGFDQAMDLLRYENIKWVLRSANQNIADYYRKTATPDSLKIRPQQ